MAEKDVRTLSDQGKAIALFEFIKELNKLKQKVVLNVADYPWHLSISDLPDASEYITVAYRDRVAEEDESASDVLLSVRKPEFEKCPAPSELFSDWLLPGGDDYHMKATITLGKHLQQMLLKQQNLPLRLLISNDLRILRSGSKPITVGSRFARNGPRVKS